MISPFLLLNTFPFAAGAIGCHMQVHFLLFFHIRCYHTKLSEFSPRLAKPPDEVMWRRLVSQQNGWSGLD